MVFNFVRAIRGVYFRARGDSRAFHSVYIHIYFYLYILTAICSDKTNRRFFVSASR